MKRFVAGADRGQWTLLPECLDDFIDESNPVRVIDAFVDALDLSDLGFDGMEPAVTGRPAYHPSTLLKLYIYGYLNRVQSSRRLEREAGRNLEVLWLLGRLVPDHKTIADFRKDNGPAIKKVCARFVELCRQMGISAGRVRDARSAKDGCQDAGGGWMQRSPDRLGHRPPIAEGDRTVHQRRRPEEAIDRRDPPAGAEQKPNRVPNVPPEKYQTRTGSVEIITQFWAHALRGS